MTGGRPHFGGFYAGAWAALRYPSWAHGRPWPRRLPGCCGVPRRVDREGVMYVAGGDAAAVVCALAEYDCLRDKAVPGANARGVRLTGRLLARGWTVPGLAAIAGAPLLALGRAVA